MRLYPDGVGLDIILESSVKIFSVARFWTESNSYLLIPIGFPEKGFGALHSFFLPPDSSISLQIGPCLASWNCSTAAPCNPNKRTPVNHGPVDFASSTRYRWTERSHYETCSFSRKVCTIFGRILISSMYLISVAVASNWTMLAAIKTNRNVFIVHQDIDR